MFTFARFRPLLRRASTGPSQRGFSTPPSSTPPSVFPSVLRGITYATLGVTVVFAGLVASDTRAAAHRNIVMPLMHQLDAETAHVLSIACARLGLTPSERSNPDKDGRLAVSFLGMPLSNPIGLAAGFDKHAEAIDALLAFGFGLVEIGSVTPVPQEGNAKPRMFRLGEDKAVINRYGFNSDGHDTVAMRLDRRIRNWLYRNTDAPVAGGELLPKGIPRSLVLDRAVGVNLGKNKVSAAEDNEDYVSGVKSLGHYADYIVINISSPNTPGLRSLQRREPMLRLMNEVRQARDTHVPHHPPILVKIAPDVSEIELQDIAAVIQESKMDGVIISNTTLSRPEYLKSDPSTVAQTGGLSGPPVFPLAVEKVRQFYALTNGTVPIIGCGGVASASDALAFARAGASLVQLYTALGYYGPGLVYDIKKGVVDELEKEGKTWVQIVGEDHRK
ncbi:Dihydroorotate dehydrogenase (quinone), mitochondrial [Podochytrium sp. JEL0797]|nr:Dihydroorotate dehydrogenase (quinone), mitochondrial [Podochytrium sp. JEL0797]